MALAIRNFRVADTSGAVDVCLIPQSGPFRVVLGEAKAASAPDAGSKVVGQLLMYYAGALTLGSQESTHCGNSPNNSKLKQNALKEHLLKRFFRT